MNGRHTIEQFVAATLANCAHTQAKSGLLLTSSVVHTIESFVLTMQLLWLTVHTQAKSGLLLTSSVVHTIESFVLTMQLLWLTVSTQAKSGLLLTSSRSSCVHSKTRAVASNAKYTVVQLRQSNPALSVSTIMSIASLCCLRIQSLLVLAYTNSRGELPLPSPH